MRQRDDFLSRTLAGERATTAYQPVVRVIPGPTSRDGQSESKRSTPQLNSLEPDAQVSPDVMAVEGIPQQRLQIQEADARPYFAWYRLLGRPWSWAWRWVLGGGIVACAVLWMVMQSVPELHPLYACLMSLCVPWAMVTLFCEMDVSRRVSWWVASLVMLFGGAASIGVSLMLWMAWGIEPTVPLAGVVEEPAKGLILLVLAMFTRQFPGILSGLALGVCVGSGFAVIETVEYAYLFGQGGEPSTEVLLVRGLFAPMMHLAWTGALGGAMWAARGPERVGFAALSSWLTWAVLAGMVVLHCLWNTIGPVQYLSLALWALIFHLAKRGVAQAESWGIAPKGA